MCYLCDEDAGDMDYDDMRPGIAQNTRKGEDKRFDSLEGNEAEQLRKGLTSKQPMPESAAFEREEMRARLHMPRKVRGF